MNVVDETVIKRIIREEILSNLSFDVNTESVYVGDNGDGSMWKEVTSVLVTYDGEAITSFDVGG